MVAGRWLLHGAAIGVGGGRDRDVAVISSVAPGVDTELYMPSDDELWGDQETQ